MHRCFLFVLLLASPWTVVHAQPDTVGKIIVDRPEGTTGSAAHETRDLWRKRYRYRLSLAHPDNQRFSPGHIPALVGLLTDGIRQGQLRAVDEHQRPCTWLDLMLRMARLQGLPLDTLAYLGPDQLDWTALAHQIELVADEGIDQNGFRFFRIQQIRLLWQASPGAPPIVLAVIRWEEARSWLEPYAPVPGFSYPYWLETRQFQATLLPAT
ncbi:MAG: hypothetical protein SF053_02730 [Bacteroidia bacterium]|nr:hypothetical protein [Bacteroidia bacterium]